WVLGEQSMKTLRGRKSEDVIFAGSDKKARLGYAEVAVHLVNEANDIPETEGEYSWMNVPELVISRRLYRDGAGEYYINGNKARLSDIQLLLAKAHFGQKTYTVIGQGLIDQILLVSPRERKEFFDEAAGVKEFQLKRHQALLKLHATRENIAQAETLLKEIEPRLRSLQRAVKRLEEREALEERLKLLQQNYYGSVWHDLQKRMGDVARVCAGDETELTKIRGGYDAMLVDLHKLEVEETQSEAIIGLQREYETLSKKRGQLREEELRLKTALEVAHVRREVQVSWAPLPLTKIIEELEALKISHRDFSKRLRAAESIAAVGTILDEFDSVADRTEQLVKRLQRPAPEEPRDEKIPADPKVAMEIENIQESILVIDGQLKELSEKMHNESHREQEKKSQFFAVQRRLQDEQRKMHEIEQRLSGRKIELAKLETRSESVREEMRMEIPEMVESVLAAAPAEMLAAPENAQRELFSLKHQLELIGGIDPEVMKEYEETNTRYTFLSEQLGDLSGALANTESTIKEFDEILKTRREEALTTLNVLFQEFFATLFKGGTAKLIPVYVDPRDELKAVSDDNEDEEDVETASEEIAEGISREPVLVGIDIQAQPPGKRIKDISVLSGGERAMTSVALLCAIMASNPSPFVVLDEVDAALDEANSIRYANILEKLAEKTQFIVITHNRATMGKGDILYGVTMGEDGASQLLSVKFAEAERWAK
ncbi:MAG: hypothetical protein NT003_00495, partial [Candidatus Magasanikbacteria bacterium]|nr:hypothetical protein [Candidatus Magasanikbacteria bacterium]